MSTDGAGKRCLPSSCLIRRTYDVSPCAFSRGPVHAKPQRRDEEPPEAPEAPPAAPAGAAVKEGLSDDIDSVLDEIDGVLESNAEEFVRGFVQKGGQ